MKCAETCTTWYGLLTEAFCPSVTLEEVLLAGVGVEELAEAVVRLGLTGSVLLVVVVLSPAFASRFCSSMRFLNISKKLPSLAKALVVSSSGSDEPSLSLPSRLELISASLSASISSTPR